MDTTPSYGHLASLYDDLFPLDAEAIAFVERSLDGLPGRSIVDAGCGTGLLARALADQGARVHGFDLDPDLLVIARTREGSDRALSLASGDLRTWTLPTSWSTTDAVVCFGNTLPHLTQEAEVDQFLSRTQAALSPRGVVLIQVLDYDYLEASRILDLPVRRVGNWTFERRYEIASRGIWIFHTSIEGPGGRKANAFPLRPWRRVDLEAGLERSGLRLEGVYGGFDGRAPGNSLPLVLQARLP